MASWIRYGLGALVVNAGLIFPGVLGAQTESASWNRVATLSQGDPIRIIQRDGRSFDGKFQGVSPESLTLDSRNNLRSLPTGSIKHVSVRRKESRWKAVGIGAAVGFGVGFPIGAASAGYLTDRNNPSFSTRAGVGAGLGLLGAGIGAGLGALAGGSRYHTVYQSK